MRHVSLVLAATAMSLLSASASAQVRVHKTAGQSTSRSLSYDPAPSHRGVPDRKECLLNRVTKKTECRTREEWHRVAARLEAEAADTQPPGHP